MITPLQSLYYAIGELAYALAKSDGKVQKEERQAFHNLVTAELKKGHHGYNISEIGFQVLDKQHATLPEVYEWAVKELRLNSHYLSPELKQAMVKVMEKLAEAYSPVTIGEQSLIDRFKKDMEGLIGDPIYYSD
jgi:hypothetical protein